jgi:hypothetical protein
MQSQNFKGKIFFSPETHAEKKTLMSYYTEPLEASFDQTIMSAWDFLNFSDAEKKQLSNNHRKLLNRYRHINPFALNVDAQELIEHINKCKIENMVIEAQDYGAYICLAALYSGKLATNKKIEFQFTKSPLALFPKTMLKTAPKNIKHKIVFNMKENCWLTPFSTLTLNEKIKCFYLKAA